MLGNYTDHLPQLIVYRFTAFYHRLQSTVYNLTFMPETLITCENVSKRFCLDLKKSLYYGVCDIVSDLTTYTATQDDAHSKTLPPLRKDEFWAVQNVSFELKRGDCLGLIGRNGAGKTTLLKMLNGLIKPDHGRIEMRGSVGALIALGSGFNPILTARENIYINGSILGLTKQEIRQQLDEIIAFAEIEEFVDTPVRNFSSGMNVRLGFAVAAIMMKPDVLLLDEVLAVGDLGFVVKCLNTVRGLLPNSATVLISHTMNKIMNFCNRGMLMDGGIVTFTSTEVSEVVMHYNRLFAEDMDDTAKITYAEGATLHHYEMSPKMIHQSIRRGKEQLVRLTLSIEIEIEESCWLKVILKSQREQPLAIFYVIDCEDDLRVLHSGHNQLEVELDASELKQGIYEVHLVISHPEGRHDILRADRINLFEIASKEPMNSTVNRLAPSNRIVADE